MTDPERVDIESEGLSGGAGNGYAGWGDGVGSFGAGDGSGDGQGCHGGGGNRRPPEVTAFGASVHARLGSHG